MLKGSRESSLVALAVGWEERIFHFYFPSSASRFLLCVLITVGSYFKYGFAAIFVNKNVYAFLMNSYLACIDSRYCLYINSRFVYVLCLYLRMIRFD